MFNFLTRGKWPFYKVLLACLLTGIFTYAISQQFNRQKKPRSSYLPAETRNPAYRTIRLKEYKFIQPILMTEGNEDTTQFTALRNFIVTATQRIKESDKDFEASVYIKTYDDGNWTAINPAATFDPGSILKLPVLIAILRKAEKNPGILDEKILFDKPHVTDIKPSIVEESLKPGTRYSVKELLYHLIVNSDNEADYMLFHFLDKETVLKVFSDLEMSVPDPSQSSVKMNCKEVSKFLRVLYNSGYTNPRLSEFTLGLLEKSRYKDGMRKGIPDDAMLVHKFGERGYANSTFQELSETGIIYLGDHRLLLTIMTKGNDQKKQADFIAEITSQACAWMKSRPANS